MFFEHAHSGRFRNQKGSSFMKSISLLSAALALAVFAVSTPASAQVKAVGGGASSGVSVSVPKDGKLHKVTINNGTMGGNAVASGPANKGVTAKAGFAGSFVGVDGGTGGVIKGPLKIDNWTQGGKGKATGW
jgi:hypothetical protein